MTNLVLPATKRLWKVLQPAQRRSLGLLFVVSVLSSLAELFLLAAVIPFAFAFSTPATADRGDLPGAFQMVARLSVTQAGLLFLAAIVLASAMRFATLRMQASCAKSIAVYLATRSYWRTLNRPYIDHVRTNANQIMVTLTARLDTVVNSIIFPFVSALSQLILGVTIVATMSLVNAWVTAVLLVTFAGAYSIFLYRARKVVIREARRRNDAVSSVTRVLSESLFGIREVLLTGTQTKWLEFYRKGQHLLRDADERIIVTSATPRIIVECVGFAIIIGIAWVLANTRSTAASALPVLALVVLGSQRLLPIAQGLYVSWNNFRSGLPDLLDLLPLLEQPDSSRPRADGPLALRDRLELRNLRYAYPGNSRTVIDGVSLIIRAGATVGIIGRTGCGKSTLLDIVMGLLRPDEGELTVDGVSLSHVNMSAWQSAISHVPQSIYIADATIAQNIALGSPDATIDRTLMCRAAGLAELAVFVEALPFGYETKVGERGELLSGGERQRIGIARALYRGTDILILDEATNALDQETEAQVMRSIKSMGAAKTIIIVTHRLSTLQNCDHIYRLTNGGLEGPVAYAELGAPS